MISRRKANGYVAWSNGARYEGEFIGDSITGEGVLTRPDGSAQKGVFVFGKMYGHVTVTDPDGIITYEGEVLANQLVDSPTGEDDITAMR